MIHDNPHATTLNIITGLSWAGQGEIRHVWSFRPFLSRRCCIESPGLMLSCSSTSPLIMATTCLSSKVLLHREWHHGFGTILELCGLALLKCNVVEMFNLSLFSCLCVISGYCYDAAAPERWARSNLGAQVLRWSCISLLFRFWWLWWNAVIF